jgi:putative membrane protein
MQQILNRPAIKAEAKSFIGQNARWWKMTLATIAIYLISGGISIYVNIATAINHDDPSTTVGYSSSVITLLLIPFTIAASGYYLNHIRGFNPEWKSLYKEGIDNYGSYLVTGVLVNVFTFLWSLLFVVPGIIKSLAYSQANYVIHDNPRLKGKEAIEISKRMTNGFKGDLFSMYLSFIGWYILVGLTGGILSIYVTPYVETTAAMYYENLKRYSIENGIVAPEAFGIAPVTGGAQGGNGDSQSSYAAGNSYSANAHSDPYKAVGINPEDTFKPGNPDSDNSDNMKGEN